MATISYIHTIVETGHSSLGGSLTVNGLIVELMVCSYQEAKIHSVDDGSPDISRRRPTILPSST